jgi:hypothetical protein
MILRSLFLLALLLSMISSMQAQLIFNKTEHDFIFRNTGDQATKILSVRSVMPSLQFIFTRSEVLSGEYGFVKVKIYPDSLEKGLFHDEVFITMKYGEEVKSEVLYIKATLDPSGKKRDNRAFEDGAISTSVEVSPSDIETMEGFIGGDGNRSALISGSQ